MPFRFRRTLSILPGLRLNVSKSGTSVSVGRPGATLNFGKKGVYGNVGIPGTGLSYREKVLGNVSDAPAVSACSRCAAPLQGAENACPRCGQTVGAKRGRAWLFLFVLVAVSIAFALFGR